MCVCGGQCDGFPAPSDSIYHFGTTQLTLSLCGPFSGQYLRRLLRPAILVEPLTVSTEARKGLKSVLFLENFLSLGVESKFSPRTHREQC